MYPPGYPDINTRTNIVVSEYTIKMIIRHPISPLTFTYLNSWINAQLIIIAIAWAQPNEPEEDCKNNIISNPVPLNPHLSILLLRQRQLHKDWLTQALPEVIVKRDWNNDTKYYPKTQRLLLIRVGVHH